jgi:methyl-accepting chemotaxis protein
MEPAENGGLSALTIGGSKMFKKIKLSGKLWGLTGLLLVAVAAVAVSSIWSIRGILETNTVYVDSAADDRFMVEKEVDHLNWVNKVQDLFLSNGEKLTVQTDYTQCGLGKFLYGEKAAEMAKKDSRIAALLEEIKTPHIHLHESAVHIGDVWKTVHPGLSLNLADRLDDHRRWAASVSGALLDGSEINVQTDPAKCAFGKWLASDEVAHLAAEWPEFAQLLKQIEGHHDKLHKSVEQIKAAELPSEKQSLYAGLTTVELGKVAELFGKLQTLEGVRVEAQLKAKGIFDKETIPALKATQAKMVEFGDYLDGVKKSAEGTMVSKGDSARYTAIAVTGVAIFVGVLLSFFLIRSVTKPINRIINNLNQGSNEVSSASEQVSEASQQLAEGASEQAASLEETSASLEEMSSMTRQNADNASQANTLMAEASDIVAKAGKTMDEMADSMAGIAESGDEISKIVKSIDEIAFQTNLLALNAAVEAARAGEAGAGFAVVADEVRNLAQRAAEAAQSTQHLIENTVSRIHAGSKLVDVTRDSFQEVAGSAEKVAALIGEVASASNEQASGIEQVNLAVNQMDQVTQGNAAAAEESASASQQLSAMAVNMNDMVDELTAVIHGGNGNGVVKQVEHNRRPVAGKLTTSPAKQSFAPVKSARSPKPSDVIPLGDEKDGFEDF